LILLPPERWLTRIPRNRALRIPSSREPESPSAATGSMPSSRSPTSSLETPRRRESRSQGLSGSPTNIFAFAAGGRHAVRVRRLGTTGR